MTADQFESLDEFALLPADASEFGLPWTGAPAVTRVTVPTKDGAVSALRWGTGQSDLVLLHGGALNAHTWDVFALAAGKPLLAIDLPGHGESDWRPDAQYAPEAIAPAIAEVIGQQASAPATIVGQSLGGLTAIALAAARPDLVARLVLVDVLPFIRNPEQVSSFLAGPQSFASRTAIVTRARAFGFGRSDAAVARGVWHNTRVRPDGSVVWKHHVGNLASQRAQGDAGDQAVPFDFSALWPTLEAFDGPVLLVRGERGVVGAEDVDALRSRVPGALVRDVATGHNVQEDDPVLLAAIVDRFLADGGQEAEGAKSR